MNNGLKDCGVVDLPPEHYQKDPHKGTMVCGITHSFRYLRSAHLEMDASNAAVEDAYVFTDVSKSALRRVELIPKRVAPDGL